MPSACLSRGDRSAASPHTLSVLPAAAHATAKTAEIAVSTGGNVSVTMPASTNAEAIATAIQVSVGGTTGAGAANADTFARLVSRRSRSTRRSGSSEDAPLPAARDAPRGKRRRAAPSGSVPPLTGAPPMRETYPRSLEKSVNPAPADAGGSPGGVSLPRQCGPGMTLPANIAAAEKRMAESRTAPGPGSPPLGNAVRRQQLPFLAGVRR